MEESKVMTHITKGLLVALILIVLGIAAHLLGFENAGWYRWVPLIILCFAIIWACVYYSNQMNGHVTFGNLFSHGFKMSAVITIILILWSVLAITVIFPEMKEKALDTARQQMEDSGQLNDSQIDQRLELTRKYFLLFAIVFTLLGTLIVGAIASLIGAAVAKKKPVNPLDQMSM
jgi:NADH:ubiquinone oxidoreductase subunit 6 (subunit J)